MYFYRFSIKPFLCLVKSLDNLFIVLHYCIHSPFIYCWLNESFRKGAKKFFLLFVKCRKRKQSQSQEVETHEEQGKLHTSVTAVDNNGQRVSLWQTTDETNNKTTAFIQNWFVVRKDTKTTHFPVIMGDISHNNLNKTYGIIVSNCASNTMTRILLTNGMFYTYIYVIHN